MSVYQNTMLLLRRKKYRIILSISIILAIIIAIVTQSLAIDPQQSTAISLYGNSVEIFFSLLFLYLGASHIPMDHTNRNILLIRTKTTQMTQYIIQNWAGYSTRIAIGYGIAWGCGAILSSLYTQSSLAFLSVSIFGSFLSTLLICSIAFLGSTILSPYIAMFCTGCIYVTGMMGQFLLRYSTKISMDATQKTLIRVMYFLTPSFSHISWRNNANETQMISRNDIVMSTGETFFFLGIILILTVVSMHYNRKKPPTLQNT